MPRKKLLKLPADVLRHWPEVFEGIEVKTIPLEYLQHIEVTFSNRKKWIIECTPALSQKRFEKDIRELFNEYGDSIRNVDFAVDSQKIKEDVQTGTKNLFKKARFKK